GGRLPRNRNHSPSLTPAGMRTCIAPEDLARPLPLQTLHGGSAFRPRPLPSWQGSAREKPPPLPRATCPVPTQVGHTRGVPFLSPVPEQALQGAWEEILSGTVAPSLASVKLSVTSDSMSWPRRGCVRVPAPPPRPNRPPKTTPRPPPKHPACPAGPPNKKLTAKLN